MPCSRPLRRGHPFRRRLELLAATRSESSFPRASRSRGAAAAALGVALFSLAWALLQAGFPGSREIVDTPVYEAYGDAVLDGRIPYRDFELEYPPGALPVFILPSLGEEPQYDELFSALMLLCGAAAVALVAAALAALEASSRRLYGGVALAALAPLLLGPVVLTRFDLWPAVLTVGALAALLAGRDRIAFGLLAAAVAAKLYPLVLLPLALVYVSGRRGRTEAIAALAVFALVLAAAFLPFALVAPDGLLESLERQARRPLQIESLGAGILLAAHRLGLYDAEVVSSHGSQNLAGALPEALATGQTVVQAAVLAGVWLLFARETPERERLVVASAAAVAALVAFGKVLSPQFLVWLVPLAPLVAGRAGLVAAGVFASALVVTQLWFPSRYWDVVALRPAGWLVLLRDFLLVALACALAVAIRRRFESPRSA